MAITSQTDIEIYEHGIIGEKDSFHLLNRIEGFNDTLILSLDVGDFNQNGRAEIFLTTLRTLSTDVQVFEYEDGRFREIWSKKGIVLRVVHRPDQAPVLVGQSSTASLSFDLLTGKLYEYTWNGSEYARQDALDIPGRVDRIFGMTLTDVDQNGVDDVLYYDQYDRIQLLQNGKLQWRSRSYEPYNMNAIRKKEDENTIRKAPGRIELTRIAADTDLRLVLINNLRAFKILKGLPMYNGSKFLIFRWNARNLSKNSALKNLTGICRIMRWPTWITTDSRKLCWQRCCAATVTSRPRKARSWSMNSNTIRRSESIFFFDQILLQGLNLQGMFSARVCPRRNPLYTKSL